MQEEGKATQKMDELTDKFVQWIRPANVLVAIVGTIVFGAMAGGVFGWLYAHNPIPQPEGQYLGFDRVWLIATIVAIVATVETFVCFSSLFEKETTFYVTDRSGGYVRPRPYQPL